jgi:hypothetical protein
LSYTISDGALSASATITITVRPVNDAPIALDLTEWTREDQRMEVYLQADDADYSALSFSIVTPPTHGTLSGSGASLFYTPAPSFNGTDSFTYKASDGTVDSNIATVSLQVLAQNDTPVVNADSYLMSGIARALGCGSRRAGQRCGRGR